MTILEGRKGTAHNTKVAYTPRIMVGLDHTFIHAYFNFNKINKNRG